MDRARQLYPELQDQNSEFFKRAMEIDQALAETSDPRYHDSDKPTFIAQMVAKELGVLPASARPRAGANPVTPPLPAKPSVQTPAPPKPEGHPKAPIASGHARAQAAPSSVEQLISKVDSPEQYEGALQALGIGDLKWGT